MSNIELKPCPFCGGEAQYTYDPDDDHLMWLDYHQAACLSCEIFVYEGTIDELHKQWNTRATTEREGQMIEAVEVELNKPILFTEFEEGKDEGLTIALTKLRSIAGV